MRKPSRCTRGGTSRYGIRIVLRRLKGHGLYPDAQLGTSIMVNGLYVEIRVRRQTIKGHPTSWNLRRHGKPVQPPPAFWALLDLTDGALFLAPAAALHGVTATRVSVLRYRDRYDLLSAPATERAA